VGDGPVTLGENIRGSHLYIVGNSRDALIIENNVDSSRPSFTFLPSGSSSDKRFIGAGSASSPYLISDADQLRLLEEYLGSAYRSVHFALTANIKLPDEWASIGSVAGGAGGFYGCFDGKNHTISNIKAKNNRARGLFSSIYGEVKNLNVEGEIVINNSDPFSLEYVGLLTSSLGREGKILNCNAKVEMDIESSDLLVGGIVGYTESGTITNCTVTGNIKTTSDMRFRSMSNDAIVGGLCGSADKNTKIINCKSSVNISSYVKSSVPTNVHIGGLVGEASYIENSSASGNVELKFDTERELSPSAGGLAGILRTGKAVNCFATGSVKIEGGYYNFAGGLIGIAGNLYGSEYALVSRSYATGSISSSGASMQNNAGGFIGQLENGNVSECWSKGKVTASGNPGYFNAAGGFAGSCYEGGTISNSYTVSSVSVTGNKLSTGAFVGRLAGNLENCYAAGDADTTSFIGSVRSNPTLQNCGDFFKKSAFYPAFYSGNGNAAGVDKITEAQLSQEATFTSRGWDFNSVWRMPTSGSYKLPVLRNVNQNAQ